MDQSKIDHVLNLLGQLSTDELEHVSKDLKKMLFRCRVQEKIDSRRENVAQRLSEAMSHHRMAQTEDD
ncbi:MAG TPA: hypothetical protein ENN39_04875 [Desulfonatronum sp.]|nr:hypothetical protein [Desulfonatronum sp.]